MNGHYEILRRLITPDVKKLALRRLTSSQNLFSGERLAVDMPREKVKIALLLVYLWNPLEDFSAEEEALLRGISSKTLRARRSQGRGKTNHFR